MSGKNRNWEPKMENNEQTFFGYWRHLSHDYKSSDYIKKIESVLHMKYKNRDHVTKCENSLALSSCNNYFLIYCKLNNVLVAFFMLGKGVRIWAKGSLTPP